MEQIEIKTKEEARQYAIEWQQWASDNNLSYSELESWGNYFRKLAEKFSLVRELKENGII